MKTTIRKKLAKFFGGKKAKDVSYMPEHLAKLIEQHPAVVEYLSREAIAKSQHVMPLSNVALAMLTFTQCYGEYRVPLLADYFNADKAFLPAWVEVFSNYTPTGLSVNAAFFERRNKNTLRAITIDALDRSCFTHGSKVDALHSRTLASLLLS